MSTVLSRVKRRFLAGEQELEVALTYVALTAVLHAASLGNTPLRPLAAHRGWWPLPLLAGAACILLRRRRLTASVCGQGLGGLALLALGSIGGYFLVFEAVFSVFLLATPAARRRTALAIAGLLAAAGGGTWAATGSFREGLLSLFIAGFVLLTPAQWAANVRSAGELGSTQQQRAEALTAATADRERLLEARHREAMALERTALAREMHDVLSARFSSIALLSGALQDRIRSTPPRESGNGREGGAEAGTGLLGSSLGTIRSESLAGLKEMTAMVRMLHSRNASPLVAGLNGLDALVDSFRATGSRIELDHRLDPVRVPDAQMGTALYRTVNELLVNHAKHAPDSTLRLSLGREDQRVVLHAANQSTGPGAQDLGGAGIGLGNIRARAEGLGGCLRVERGERDFSVQVTLPCPEAHGPGSEPPGQDGAETSPAKDGTETTTARDGLRA